MIKKELASNESSVSSNMIWRLLERFGAQGVTLIVSIVLARLLDPEIYGIVAIVTIIITIFQVFLDGGFSTALIQKKDSDDLDFSSVFYFNLFLSSILYVILFFIAPFIASFCKMNELTPLIRVLGLELIIFSVKSIQQAYVSKKMIFRKFFFSTLGGTIGAGLLGIFLAYKGFGVWALVLQQIFNMLVDTIILWFTVKWRPKLIFSWSRLKVLISFGWKLLLAALLENIYNEIRQLIIGRKYSSTDLAYYNQGQKYTAVIATNINSSIDSVLFPTLSKVQNNTVLVKTLTRKSIKVSSFIMFPVMCGIAFCSKQIILLLLTEKWLPCLPFLVISCINFAFYPIHTANLNAIKALGRSDLFLKLEVEKKILGVIILLSTIWFGPLVMAYSLILSTLLSMAINSFPNKKLLNYSLKEQMIDIFPYFLTSVFMGCVVYCVGFLNMSTWLTLITQILLGVVIYIGVACIFKMEPFLYCLDVIKGYLHKNKKVETNEQN